MANTEIETAQAEIQALRKERNNLREERDALRQDLASLKQDVEENGSARLKVLAVQLSEEIRERFYGNLKTLLWIFAILVSAATAGGYLTISSRVDGVIDGIDKKVGAAVAKEVADREADIEQLRQNVIGAVVEFRTKAALELDAVGKTKEATIAEFTANAEDALAAIDAELRRVEREGQRATDTISVRVTEVLYQQQKTQSAAKRGDLIRIPVVVHVVYNDDAANIDEAQIKSQIRVLNEDFQARNADLSTVPEPFKPQIGNAGIEFFLATTDPEGKSTNGITRTQTDTVAMQSEEVKRASNGGADAWDTQRYLNFWVTSLSQGMVGISQFPNGPAETDGVVLSHTAFGTTGTATAPFDKGRAGTQQVAQWLGLRHIWGDDGTACSGTDGIDDTPNQAGPNWGKPTFPSISCGNGPAGDMFMNFLDYTDDDTAVMFTKGQVKRMRETLATIRREIGAGF